MPLPRPIQKLVKVNEEAVAKDKSESKASD
jgi:hypothetical protein